MKNQCHGSHTPVGGYSGAHWNNKVACPKCGRRKIGVTKTGHLRVHSAYHIEPAFTLQDDREVRDGWDLLRGDEWCQRFATRREARAALLQLVTK